MEPSENRKVTDSTRRKGCGRIYGTTPLLLLDTMELARA